MDFIITTRRNNNNNNNNMRCRITLLQVAGLLVFLPCLALAGFVDMDTPLDKRTTTSLIDGTTYHLVMSDEFNVDKRTFKDGHDSVWTALDKSDDDASSAGGGSLQFYNSSSVTTDKGFLEIHTKLGTNEWNHYDKVKKKWKHVKTNFTSGMIQSWNKFCFTGGIIEVDVIFPGTASIGGLWPAIWMLGNLGRATYESSTNNIWPWSFDTCDRDLQPGQKISACNTENHFGMKAHQGRGATEIDIVEVMYGVVKDGMLPGTDPPIGFPYADFTLQVAPGVPDNRPQSGSQPVKESTLSKNGHTLFNGQTWYEGLERESNTSINPFFYGTYLAETKPNEPVSRTKKQAFQADAVGVIHQLTASHFTKPHTFRLEWQPGRGGRLDWFVKGYKVPPGSNTTQKFMVGDGNGQEWVKAFTIKDESLNSLMGSQIPIEPSYLILNTAVSSTWGFPYDTPSYCQKCYDCKDPKCACNFYPGFCKQLDQGVTMYVDNIRVYQSNNNSAHVGAPHTLGCDPPDYPTKEWIDGHEYQYMRNAPFSYEDKGMLRKVQRGGGKCETDSDCGGDINHENLTAIYHNRQPLSTERRTKEEQIPENESPQLGRGYCKAGMANALFSSNRDDKVCTCRAGYTGPHCLSQAFTDDSVSAYELHARDSPFLNISNVEVPSILVVFGTLLLLFLILSMTAAKRAKLAGAASIEATSKPRKPNFAAWDDSQQNATIITGTSI